MVTQEIVGQEGIVSSRHEWGISIVNDLGGTSTLPQGDYRVRVTRAWGDYEIGARCEGELLDHTSIEIARATGTTGYSPRVLFEPHRVYFAARDFNTEVADG